jgi:hypothetical protein
MPDTKIISFRITDRHHATLVERAAVNGQSAGDLARQLVLEGLVSTQLTSAIEEPVQEGLQEMRYLQTKVTALQTDLVTCVKALLVTVGKVPLQEADAWIEANLGGGDA